MSAKKRKPSSLELDVANAGRADEREVESVEMADNKASAIAQLAKNGSPAAKLAAQRALLILQRLKENGLISPELALAQPKRGRPRDPLLEKAMKDYEFDVEHYDALRSLGWGNVPADKEVIDKTITRHWPNPSDAAEQDRKRTALRVALSRRRKARG